MARKIQISVRFSCPEVLRGLKSGVYDVVEGTSVRELLAICERECDFQVNEKHLKWLLVIADGRQAGWNTILSEGGKVSFLRGALGG